MICKNIKHLWIIFGFSSIIIAGMLNSNAQSLQKVGIDSPKVICCGVKYYNAPVIIRDSVCTTSFDSPHEYHRICNYLVEQSVFDSAGWNVNTLLLNYRDSCVDVDVCVHSWFVREYIIPSLPDSCSCRELLRNSYPSLPLIQYAEYEDLNLLYEQGFTKNSHHTYLILLVKIGLYNDYYSSIEHRYFRYSLDPLFRETYMAFAIPIKGE